MSKKIVLSIILSFAVLFSASVCSLSQNITLDDLLLKLQTNKSKIADMYSEMTTTITGSGKMATGSGMGNTQKAKMWTKGDDKSKIEMLEPIKQTTIRNGAKMVIIDEGTGQKIVKDLSADKSGMSSYNQGNMDFEKIKTLFDLSVRTDGGFYVITCTPKQKSFLGKMEIYVDHEKYLSSKILVYDKNNKLMNQTDIEYKDISGVSVPVKMLSSIDSPVGKMKIEIEYSNIKVNQGMGDSEFKI